MWTYDTIHKRFRATLADRQFDIEPPASPRHEQTYTLWFRRNEKPHRSLLVGKFPSINDAQAAARDISQQLVSLTHIYQD